MREERFSIRVSPSFPPNNVKSGPSVRRIDKSPIAATKESKRGTSFLNNSQLCLSASSCSAVTKYDCTESSERKVAKLRESSACLRLASSEQNRTFFLHKPVKGYEEAPALQAGKAAAEQNNSAVQQKLLVSPPCCCLLQMASPSVHPSSIHEWCDASRHCETLGVNSIELLTIFLTIFLKF